MAYPSLPASPTLTNPDMILPYGEYDSTPSPPQNAYEPEDESWGRSSREMHFSIGPAHAPLGTITPTTPIIYGNGTMLSDIGEVTEAESTVGRKLPSPAERRLLKQQAQGTAVRSSPILGYHPIIMKRSKIGVHERKTSIESTSTVTSDVPAADLFKDFDDGVSVDDSVFQGDDEESVADSYAAQMIAAETIRLSKKADNIGQEEDQNSSAALSRRAEQILLNAKKRLNNMEGNLSRARTSLYITPASSLSSVSSIHSSSPLTRLTPSPSNRSDPQLGAPPSKHRQLNTPDDSPASPGHSRVYSENSISPNIRSVRFPVRASSAAARYMGDENSRRSPPLSQTPESARERPLASSLTKASPPRPQLEPLSENEAAPEFDADRESARSSMDESRDPGSEDRGTTRSSSSLQMRDLRDQMHDLKGRLSVLRDRARDDTMKRRSLQNLRTPSPFTAAKEWYSASKNYGDGGLSADAGVPQPPWKAGEAKGSSSDEKPRSASRTSVSRKGDTLIASGYAASDVTSVYEDVSEGRHASVELEEHAPQEGEEETYKTVGELPEGIDDDIDSDYNDEMVNHEELNDYESDVSSYHDTLTTPLSHEDREDAFDYEHFFLHSAMGTIGQQRHGRRDSVGSYSSEDSVETTRGPTAPNDVNERPSIMHFRSQSADSISTMATFATATEGLGSQNGEDETDDFAVQNIIAPPLRTTTPVTAKRSTFGSPFTNGLPNDRQPTPEDSSRPSSAIHDHDLRNGSDPHRPSVASFDSFESTGTSRSFPLVNKPTGQKSLTPDIRTSQQSGSILSESNTLMESQGAGERMQSSPVHMLARDEQVLVERLVASLGKCVLGLQEAGKGSYDSKIWRRRLDAARRMLEGEEGLM